MVHDLKYVEPDRQADRRQTYYYLREVARVGGRPKIVSQRYLGKADDIDAAMDGVTALPERDPAPGVRGCGGGLVGDRAARGDPDHR